MPVLSGPGLLEKILITAALVVAVLVVAAIVRTVARAILGGAAAGRPRFWVAQVVRLLTLAAVVLIIVRLWISGSSERGAIMGWIAAGLAIALQRVVTAFAVYLIILRGNAFTVGDRITIGGVRGDVIALGFMQTTVMEMGQSPSEQQDDPSMWVRGRQYSGRIIRVTNDKVFDMPIYNYTRDFPYMWDELAIPIRYADDYEKVEGMLLDIARKHTTEIMGKASRSLAGLHGKYFLSETPDVEPHVYIRITDNWVELSLRYIALPTGARVLKNAISRDILVALAKAKIGVASGTYAIVEVPPITIQQVPRSS
jgi:small-conductance mechanosensitive channel